MKALHRVIFIWMEIQASASVLSRPFYGFFGLKARLVSVVNMTLVGSLLLGRVSFHGVRYMWVHCMPVLE